MPNYKQPFSSPISSTKRSKHLENSQNIPRQRRIPTQPPKNPIPHRRNNFTSHEEIRGCLNNQRAKGAEDSPQGQLDFAIN